MKKYGFLFLLILFICPLGAQETAQVSVDTAAGMAETVSAASVDPAERNRMLYSLGFLLGDNLKRQLILDNEDDYKALSQGMRDSLLNKQSQTTLDDYKPQIIEKYRQDAQTISQRREAEQKKFLEDFSKEKGVKVLDNGVMIKLAKKGKGRTANTNSTVTVNYEGKLIDGTKFDSSYDRNEPFTAPLSGVIACWSKAFQQLRPASKATVVCPAETAYGSRPVGVIPPNSVLVFEVEVLDIDND